jgi:ABC transporter with metal-binding/Fe-S-binding domain ATP-binding protein
LQLAALISGGKDSALALHRVLKQGHEVKNLVTMIPLQADSWMFHYPNIHLTDLFAQAVGIPLVKAKTTGAKEVELEDLKRLLSKLDVEGVVSGAVASEYQKTRVERICQELALKSITPLWHGDPYALLQEIVNEHFETIFVGVYAYGFDASWLGRVIDSKTIDKLVELNRRYQISIVGEGGEYETLVLDAPFFKKKIQLVSTEKVWEGQSGCLRVGEAELAEKIY